MNVNEHTLSIFHLLRTINIFYQRRLLTSSVYSICKDLVFSKDVELLSIFNGGDLDVMSGNSFYNNDNFQHLFNAIEKRAIKCIESKIKNIFEKSYAIDDAHIIASRTNIENDIKSLVYGEVEFESFVEVLNIATEGLEKQQKFVDLGGGCAKALAICAGTTNFTHLVGIEIIPGLHDISMKTAEVFQNEFGLIHRPAFSLYCGSFLDTEELHDWTDADLVFANSTCFSQDLLVQIELIARRLRIGARLITFTVPIESQYFRVFFKKRLFMSWGPATVFIHQRVSNDNLQSLGETIGEQRNNFYDKEKSHNNIDDDDGNYNFNNDNNIDDDKNNRNNTPNNEDDLKDNNNSGDNNNNNNNNNTSNSNNTNEGDEEFEKEIQENYPFSYTNLMLDIDDERTQTTYDGNSYAGSRSGRFTIGSSINAVGGADESASESSGSSLPSSPDQSIASKYRYDHKSAKLTSEIGSKEDKISSKYFQEKDCFLDDDAHQYETYEIAPQKSSHGGRAGAGAVETEFISVDAFHVDDDDSFFAIDAEDESKEKERKYDIDDDNDDDDNDSDDDNDDDDDDDEEEGDDDESYEFIDK